MRTKKKNTRTRGKRTSAREKARARAGRGTGGMVYRAFVRATRKAGFFR